VKIFTHDGARINEDYFNLVEPDTTFTVLKEEEVWDNQQNSKLNDTVSESFFELWNVRISL